MSVPAAPPSPFPSPLPRIAAIDVARGAALVAMAVYHFAWDLEFFGYADPGMTAQGNWKLFARAIASSFLFLAGVSLFLAHAGGIRWPSFWRRLAMVAGAAAAITLATRIATPEGFIFFGILHQIALASVLGLTLLRLPWPLILLLAAAAVAAPHFLRSTLFDHPPLWFVGLSATIPRSNDYVPLLPWFGAVLSGIAAAKAAAAAGLPARLARIGMPRWTAPLALGGRHSLLVYLVHQPVLVALLFGVSQVAPPAAETQQVRFRQSCQATCTRERGEEFCVRYCLCMLEEIGSEGLLDDVFSVPGDAETAGRLRALAVGCVAATVEAGEAGGGQ